MTLVKISFGLFVSQRCSSYFKSMLYYLLKTLLTETYIIMYAIINISRMEEVSNKDTHASIVGNNANSMV